VRAAGWIAHLRGHFLLFNRQFVATDSAGAGSRLLFAAVFIEAARLAAVKWLSPGVPLWLLVAVFLGLALLAVPVIAGINLSELGFRPWRAWTLTEKSYFCQVIVLANVVFPLVLAAPIGKRVAELGLSASLANVFVPYLMFGFYQEVVYRGMLQSELVRRWGAVAGILAADLLYTFGPLHWNYFASRASAAAPMFAAIFAIGLFFGVLYQRSGNLWIVATFHAIGNAYILWSVGAVQ
jgi:membrane protease YdiL (CAAX protease family)